MSTAFPDESAEYRRARNELLDAEIDLRRQIERVAELRRRLPPGGKVREDYVFQEGARDLNDRSTTRTVRLSELFEPGKDTLLLYSLMYGPAMSAPCPMCASLVDGFNAVAPHLTERANFAVVAKSPVERIRELARSRGWDRVRFLSSAANTYNRDYHGETADGGQMPMMNVFVRRDGAVHHFYGSELLYTPPDPGQDPRHIDIVWPLWNLLDLTPEGRGAKWYPTLKY